MTSTPRTDLAALHCGNARATLLHLFQRPHGRALRIGVSGGIGSGKSSFARALAENAAVLADADAIAREVVQVGTPGLAAVAKRFGPTVIDDRRGLDRAALAQIIFGDPQAKADLEAILHPRIAERSAQILSSAAPGELAIYDVPLLVETNMAAQFDAVIMVDAPQDVRLDRLVQRGLERSEAERRMAAQASRAEREKVAHLWVENTGTAADLSELAHKCDACWLRPSEDE
ncbi:MAG: dephospho-CoA kinase [Actinomycetaceae bacterium]|nr:dephospho-CoA kinase [Actinomycetaceae bacterium]